MDLEGENHACSLGPEPDVHVRCRFWGPGRDAEDWIFLMDWVQDAWSSWWVPGGPHCWTAHGYATGQGLTDLLRLSHRADMETTSMGIAWDSVKHHISLFLFLVMCSEIPRGSNEQFSLYALWFSGRGQVDEKTVEKFKAFTRQKNIPEENIVKISDSGNVTPYIFFLNVSLTRYVNTL